MSEKQKSGAAKKVAKTTAEGADEEKSVAKPKPEAGAEAPPAPIMHGGVPAGPLRPLSPPLPPA